MRRGSTAQRSRAVPPTRLATTRTSRSGTDTRKYLGRRTRCLLVDGCVGGPRADCDPPNAANPSTVRVGAAGSSDPGTFTATPPTQGARARLDAQLTGTRIAILPKRENSE